MNEEQLSGIITRKDFDTFVELYDQFECPICDVAEPLFSQIEVRFHRKLDELIYLIQTTEPNLDSRDIRRALIQRARRQLKARKQSPFCDNQ